MAVALNATFGAAANGTLGTTSPALPTNWAVGQLAVTYAVLRSPTATATISANWNMLGPFRNTDATNPLTLYLGYKTTVTSQAAPTWTFSSSLLVISRTYTFTDAQALGLPGVVWTGAVATNGNSGPVLGVDSPGGSGVINFNMLSDDFNAPVATTGWTSMGAQEIVANPGLTGFPQFIATASTTKTADLTVVTSPTAATQGLSLQIPVLQFAVPPSTRYWKTARMRASNW